MKKNIFIIMILLVIIFFVCNCKKIIPLPIEMVLVESGSFIMGIDNGSDSNQKPSHNVVITKSFYMSKYEITFEQYDLFCEDQKKELPRDEGWGRGKNPVINVSYYEAVEFCNWMSDKEGLEKCYEKVSSEGQKWNSNYIVNGYRLPTEAEWEYAARGGSNGNGYIYSGSDTINEVAWFGGNSDRIPHPVGQLKPNELGLFDMSGNVGEWCNDWFDGMYYSKSPENDPVGPDTGSWFKSLRGGSFANSKIGLPVYFRDTEDGAVKDKNFGFRVIRNKSEGYENEK